MILSIRSVFAARLERIVHSNVDHQRRHARGGFAKMTHTHRIPWYLWPFAAIWRLIATIVGLTGRFLAMVVGLVLLVVGVLVSLTVIGAIVGIPMAIIGILLFLRGVF